jgi:hypothetical protein
MGSEADSNEGEAGATWRKSCRERARIEMTCNHEPPSRAAVLIA